jgi:ribosomal-protein-alanine N-acetyltransferase
MAALEAMGQWPPWTRQDLADALTDARAHVLGAVENDALIAHAVLYRLPFEAELQLLTVRPDRRRRGIAGALLERLIEKARGWESERLLLEVRDTNLAARALYIGKGFTLDGRRRGYYQCRDGGREDALLMSRGLAS